MTPHQKKKLQAQVLVAIFEERTFRAAYQRCGLAEGTVRQWRKEPEFSAQYEAILRSCNDLAKEHLTQAAKSHVAILSDIAQDPTAHANARVQASKTALEVLLKLENQQLEARVLALEVAQLEALKERDKPYETQPESQGSGAGSGTGRPCD